MKTETIGKHIILFYALASAVFFLIGDPVAYLLMLSSAYLHAVVILITLRLRQEMFEVEH